MTPLLPLWGSSVGIRICQSLGYKLQSFYVALLSCQILGSQEAFLGQLSLANCFPNHSKMDVGFKIIWIQFNCMKEVCNCFVKLTGKCPSETSIVVGDGVI